jgi:hypothetical protein
MPSSTTIVADGRILGVGSLADLQGRGLHDVDDRFDHQVLMPGLVEAHSHLSAGGFWRQPNADTSTRAIPTAAGGPM